jgi:hypothetical protein
LYYVLEEVSSDCTRHDQVWSIPASVRPVDYAAGTFAVEPLRDDDDDDADDDEGDDEDDDKSKKKEAEERQWNEVMNPLFSVSEWMKRPQSQPVLSFPVLLFPSMQSLPQPTQVEVRNQSHHMYFVSLQ